MAQAVGILCLLSVSACTPKATFELDVPSAVAQNAAWYEVGVFSSTCPSAALLLGGIPQEGVVSRLAFAASSSVPPGLGALRNSSYGVAAVARAKDCSVIATGCSNLNVSGSDTLTVSLAAISGTAQGACSSGSACDEGACLPSADASVGASCSLQLVGAGPLADPLTESSGDTDSLSAPAIVATPSGFLLAYREFDQEASNGRLTTIALDPSGGASAPVTTTLQGTCSPASPDATGLAFSTTSGTVVVSRPACTTDAGSAPGGADLFSVNAQGAVSKPEFSNQGTLAFTLAQAHALAYTPEGLLLAYTNQMTNSAFAVSVVNGTVSSASTLMPLSGWNTFTNDTVASVVGTTLGTGFLVLGTTSFDGGAPSASAFSLATEPADAGPSDAGLPKSASHTADWVSLGGVDSRVIVASDVSGDPTSIRWSAYDIGTSARVSTSTFSPQSGEGSGGNVAFADVALQQDHAFFAAEVDSDIWLVAFDKASTSPAQLAQVQFSTLPIIPVGALRDGLVAVAASDTRVAVVWGTGRQLTQNDDVGGYAIFACTQ